MVPVGLTQAETNYLILKLQCEKQLWATQYVMMTIKCTKNFCFFDSIY